MLFDMNSIKTRNMIITALLTAFAIVIPMFTFLRVTIPPVFTATLSLHVPVMVAMFISPVSAAFVSLGGAIGFLVFPSAGAAPMVVAARAATHIVFAVSGAYMIKKMTSFSLVKFVIIGLVLMPIHAIAEAFVVIPFLPSGADVIYTAFLVTGVGTAIHHSIDYIITFGVINALDGAKLLELKK